MDKLLLLDNIIETEIKNIGDLDELLTNIDEIDEAIKVVKNDIKQIKETKISIDQLKISSDNIIKAFNKYINRTNKSIMETTEQYKKVQDMIENNVINSVEKVEQEILNIKKIFIESKERIIKTKKTIKILSDKI